MDTFKGFDDTRFCDDKLLHQYIAKFLTQLACKRSIINEYWN